MSPSRSVCGHKKSPISLFTCNLSIGHYGPHEKQIYSGGKMVTMGMWLDADMIAYEEMMERLDEWFETVE